MTKPRDISIEELRASRREFKFDFNLENDGLPEGQSLPTEVLDYLTGDSVERAECRHLLMYLKVFAIEVHGEEYLLSWTEDHRGTDLADLEERLLELVRKEFPREDFLVGQEAR